MLYFSVSSLGKQATLSVTTATLFIVFPSPALKTVLSTRSNRVAKSPPIDLAVKSYKQTGVKFQMLVFSRSKSCQ